MIRERLTSLREDMRREGIDFSLFTSMDDHASEYVGDYYKVSDFFSGCTSDNVVMIVSAKEARLWTDARYFISAARELDGTTIELMRMGKPGVPTVSEYLQEVIESGKTLGFDGRCVTAAAGEKYREIAAGRGATIESEYTPAERIWKNRPLLSMTEAFVLEEELAGQSYQEKAAAVRGHMEKKTADWLVLSKLDDIMWLLNLRGGDIAFNPVLMSYLILGADSAHLFIQKGALNEVVLEYLSLNHINVYPYEDIFSYIEKTVFDGNVLIDKDSTSDRMLHLLREKEKEGCSVVFGMNPTTGFKAVKNPVELENLRRVYLQDSVAVCKFIYYIKSNVGKIPMTEVSAADYLDHLRSEIPGFLDLSFGTISAYNTNAAMAHYAPDRNSPVPIAPRGFLLVDSGGQYLGGTTDVTRTIVLGDLTADMISDYTTVAISNLRLLYAKFMYGVNGMGLDIYARAPFWERGKNFNHGTGHGIGYILNVHEGPQSIRFKSRAVGEEVPFEPGMITSDEPGMYVENAYGIRIETIVECVEDETNEFGRFLRFAPLTYAPIDLDAIDRSMMDASDIRKLNEYHQIVFEKVSPFLEEEERSWLREATRAI